MFSTDVSSLANQLTSVGNPAGSIDFSNMGPLEIICIIILIIFVIFCSSGSGTSDNGLTEKDIRKVKIDDTTWAIVLKSNSRELKRGTFQECQEWMKQNIKRQ